MNKVNRFYVMLALALFSMVLPLHAALDATLFTNYTLNPGGQTIEWVVCGSLPGTSGCYGAGSIGPFGKIGAMMEGLPKVNAAKGTVTRFIYVLDVAAGAGADQVELNLFKKVDTISGGDDTVTVTSYKTVTLPLTGGSSTLASMAANRKFLYVGTNQDELALQITKSSLVIAQFSGISGPLTVSSITANQYGFITVTWGSSGGPGGFETIDPTGRPSEDGGGTPFTLNTTQATLPSALP